MPTGASNIFGGGGLKVGQFASGNLANDSDFLPLDGSEYLKSAYPMLDYTGMTSFGGNQLTSQTLPTTQAWAGAFGNGVFVAVPSAVANTVAASSTDGVTWTSRTIPNGIYYCVIYAAGLFVAIGSAICATSPDGVTWTARTFTLSQAYRVAYGNGLFVAISSNYAGTTYATSPDGVTWTTRTLPYSGGFGAIKFAEGLFRALLYMNTGGVGDSSLMIESPDALRWSGAQNTVLPGSTTLMEHFKGRTFASDKFVTTPTSTLASGGAVGWAYSSHSWAGLFRAGEWLGTYTNLAYWSQPLAINLSTDGQAWMKFGLPSGASLGTSIDSARAAFGNGVLVLFSSVSSSTCLTLSVDATKFRVPVQIASSEADRLYIKAK